VNPLADSAARARIRTDLGTTLVVEAAAGTGKTTELVARIVALIRGGMTTLDRILSVTFTDPAAGEMKLRLRTELEAARAQATVEEQARLTAALEELEAAPISTIHSFCADLLRERPVEARVDPVFQVAAGEEQERLFDQAFEGWFQRIVASPAEGVRRLLRRKVRASDTPPRELLRGAGRDLAEHRDFDGAWRREPFARSAGLDRVVRKLAEVGALAAKAQDPSEKSAQSIAEIDRWIADLSRRESSRGRDEDGLEAELHELSGRYWVWKRYGRGRWFAPGLERKSVLALRDAAKAELDSFLALCGADLAACLREELRPLCAAYEKLKEKAGALDFLDLLLRARDLVRNDATVRAELQQRFTHVLVDEFQDTDPLQAEILLLIAADDAAQSDWRRTRPLPGKLFVVGDPKQSIYRFRRADIALYEGVKALLLRSGAELLHLTTSFRSVPDIQQAVNTGFSPQMQGQTQAGYVPLDPYRAPIVGQPAVVALPAPRLYGKYEKIINQSIEESYPGAVAAFVEWLVQKSGWKVSERDKPEPVPVEARHVCLLFKRMRGWDGDLTRPYVRALEARRIPHVLVGGRSYHAREEVLAMRTAAAAIECPDDELSVFAALKGPLFALGDGALLLFREKRGRLHPLRSLADVDLSAEEAEVAAALAVLGELHRHRNRRPIAETLSRLLDQTRAHAGIAIWPAGEQALANVLRVLELARRFESAGASSFRAFVDRLAADAERGEAAEAPVVEEGTEGVRIMTVHKAKGLEFPVAILCDPCAPAVPKNPSRLVDAEKRVWAMPLAGCSPVELMTDREALLQRDREEAVRLAYVAATRARDLLVVPVTGDGELASWLEPLNKALYPPPDQRRQPRPAPGCPAFGKETVLDRPEGLFISLSVSPGLHQPPGAPEVVWWDPHALDLDREVEGGLRSHDLLVEGGASGPTSEAHARWQERRQKAAAEGARPSLRVEPATARSRTAAGTGAAEVALAAVEPREANRPGGRRFGTLVHAVLAEADLRAGPEILLRIASAQGRLVGAPAEEVSAAARAVEAALRHPLLQRAAASAECRREEPIAHLLPDGTLLEGVVDLAFRDGPGWMVVDFKTDARAEPHARYAAQLRLYCAAIQAATGLEARAALLSV
jgi:ATP-dependent exoDNAse (exonuclease V) beta subunit